MGALSFSRADRDPKRRPYCLRCFAPLPSGSDHCDRCDFVSRRTLRRTYWNLNPRLRRLETAVKIAVAALTLGLIVLVVTAVPAWMEGTGTLGSYGSRRTAGWFIALPLFLGFGAWQTASKITHRRPYFRAAVFWGVLFALLSVFVFLWAGIWGLFPAVAPLAVVAVQGVFVRWRDALIEEAAFAQPGTP